MMKNNKILVVDDDPEIRDLMHRILSAVRTSPSTSKAPSLFDGIEIPDESVNNRVNNKCYKLTLVESGEEGIEAVKESLKNKTPYSAAFVDMMMGGLNGAETAGWMWQLDPNIRIVIVTGFGQYLSEDYTMVTGRKDLFYLRKPFNPEEIRQFARALTEQWSLEIEKEKLTNELKTAKEKLEDMNNNLQQKVEEQTTMLIQQDKMASIGLLAAGVAHEVNNPIAFVNNNLTSLKSYCSNIISFLKKYNKLEKSIEKESKDKIPKLVEEIRDFAAKQKIDFITNDMLELIEDSLEGTQRVSKIVSDLKSFARVREGDIEQIDLNEVMDASLNILRNELKYKVEIIKDFGELPKIKCFVQKISQVFVNILTNASQAIKEKEKGTIKIFTKHIKNYDKSKEEYIETRISDDGCGIPQKHITKIFDPFFTTKPVGVGTGLGLKITYDIIKAHGGDIMVESEVGKGTTFIIRLPLETKL